MTNIISWNQAKNKGGRDSTTLSEEGYCEQFDSSSSSYKSKNPLDHLPFSVRESLTTEYYDPGKRSVGQRYMESLLKRGDKDVVQKLMNNLYHYAIRKNSHILAGNIIIILSQLPYKELDRWADMLALSGTNAPYYDVQEYGIRCFENWEDREACEFLRNCRFGEKWLQEYADEVCDYILSEGKMRDVLSEEGISWEMARRRTNATGKIDGYQSGYRDSRA